MAGIYSFGEWIKKRRTLLRFTQRAIAEQVFCSTAMIKKIEADERQPSPELAELLAQALQIPSAFRRTFLACARGEQPVDNLPADLSEPAPVVNAPPSLTLPNPSTPFIGRATELAEITSLLGKDGCRLLTLAGAGGIGKTRLALEAARTVQPAFADGVSFVNLATVTDSTALVQATAQALGTPLLGSEPPQMQLQRILRRRNVLLVLDNFEQLASGAPALSEWLAAASDLKLLITSRERLNLAEEWLYPVSGLGEEAATMLFVQTAQRARPSFDPSREEVAVADVCRTVSGHALAVELAASWVRLMPCTQIAAQIKQDLDFLADGPRNIPDRHRSLRALFDHSWVLLSMAEQSALAKLSVFRGGFAAEQAATVAGATWSLLRGLVDKSLVEASSMQRYNLHELVRQYAAEQLTSTGETDEVRQRHFESYCALGYELARQTTGPHAITSQTQFYQEHENFQAALAWGLETHQTEPVLSLTNDNYLFWLRGGHWQEGEHWVQAALRANGDTETPQVAEALCRLAAFSALQGRFQDAHPAAQRVLIMAHRLEDPRALVANLVLQGQAEPDRERAYAAYEEASAICRAYAADWRMNYVLTELLWLYGSRLMGHGDVAQAEAKYKESLARYRALEDVSMIAYPLGHLGQLALRDGRLDEAYALILESAHYAAGGGNRVAMGDWLFRLGQVRMYLGDLEAASADLQTTLRLCEEMHNVVGQAAVLACLAEVALVQGNIMAARRQIQESFACYSALYASISMISNVSRQTHYSDVTDSICRAGLVAAAQGEQAKAAMLLTGAVVWASETGYNSIPPLQAKVNSALAADASP